MEIYSDYKTQYCSVSGDQELNLNWEQAKGYKSLRRRSKEENLMVLVTDKSGKPTAVSRPIYLTMGSIHTAKDQEITWKEVEAIQRGLNGHCSMWAKILNMGEAWGHEDRIRESCIHKSEIVPPMTLLIKDHKPKSSNGMFKT